MKKRRITTNTIDAENLVCVWDLDNTIWTHPINETEIFCDKLNISNISEFQKQFYMMVEIFHQYFATSKVTFSKTLSIISQHMPILRANNISPEKFMATWNSSKSLTTEFNHDTITVLKYLHKKNVKNIIKTDWWEYTQKPLLEEYGILEYFSEIYYCDNSYLKCNPLSVDSVIKKDCPYVMIGDSLYSDIAFAHYANIQSIWLNPSGKKNNSMFCPDFQISSLLEVMAIII